MLKNRCFPACLYGVLLWLLPFSGYANEFAAEVRQAEITLEGDSYVLSADILYQLSDKAMEALQNGVPLFWDLQVKVQQQRDFLWNKTLVDTTIRYRLQYHALLNMYRVKNEGDGEVYNFSTLSAALDSMSAIRGFRLIEKTELGPEKQYLCAVKVNFDRDALPLPLRPIAYIDPQWYLSSDWTLWPLKK
ncbi:MAG: DUF4390 domain-containing protein [Methylococcaceae bacterium]